MTRLQKSADHWKFQLDASRLAKEAATLTRDWTAPMKVRLLLSRFGESCWQAQAIRAVPPNMFAVLSPNRMRSDDIFLYHKTSHRAYYDDERRRLQAETGCFECLFANERDELTEGSFTNIFMQIGSEFLTPTLACGLLPGILRQNLLERSEVREAVLTLEDLQRADALFVGNSVRGLMQVAFHQF